MKKKRRIFYFMSELQRKDLASIPFLKKSAYTGSYNGIRFKLQKKEQDEIIYLEVFVWPEPFCFDKTAEDKKHSTLFSFNNEGIEKARQWIMDCNL